jgi:hypothetical protein
MRTPADALARFEHAVAQLRACALSEGWFDILEAGPPHLLENADAAILVWYSKPRAKKAETWGDMDDRFMQPTLGIRSVYWRLPTILDRAWCGANELETLGWQDLE